MAIYYAIVQHEPDETYLQVDHVKNLQIYENKSSAISDIIPEIEKTKESIMTMLNNEIN